MKPASLLALALLLPCPAAAGWLAAPGAAAVQEDPQRAYDEFVAEFKQYLKVNDAAEIARLVGRKVDVAVRVADTLCQQIAIHGSDELEKQIAALRVAWKTAMKTDFVEKLYEYHSLLDPRLKAERARLVQAYDKALVAHFEARAGHDNGPALQISAETFRGLAGGFAEVGDQLNVGRCWVIVANCLDEELRHKDADLYGAARAWSKAVEAYAQIGLAGATMSATRERFEHLERQGFMGEPPDPDAPKPGQPVAAATAGPSLTAAMTFEPVEEVEDWARPSYFADDLYQIWPTISMQGKGTSSTFSTMQTGSPRVERTGAVEFSVRDAADEPREPITATGNLTLVPATLDQNGARREWAVVAKIGLAEDRYQDRAAYLAPSDFGLSLFYFNGASVVGTLNGVQVRVLDDNMDGVYGSMPLMWQYLGLAKDFAQPDMDAVVIGSSKRALPWSEIQQIGDAWFKLEPVDGGVELRATPMELATGTLKLDFKGTWPDWLVVRGQGVLEWCFYDLCANSKKAVEVPVGDYQVFGGLVRKGKKQQAMKCLVLPGPEPRSWTVEAGKETVVELGAPLAFVFDVRESGDKVLVPGAGVRVQGVAGEMYDRFWNCAPQPEVAVRKKGSKSGGKGEEMPIVLGDLNEVKDDGTRVWSFADVWRPLDLELKRPAGASEGIEVRLTEKKNKLLGKIESDWN